jgi:site-specific DNA-methyltransferase (adenine-specific)
VLFSRAQDTWRTPRELYAALEEEFGPFTLDPCPLDTSATAGASLWGKDGLQLDWRGHRLFLNPPYGRGIGQWLAKAQDAELAVVLLPARTDTQWFHVFGPLAAEIRFLRGRLRFGDARSGAPFPSVLLIYRKR